jgi:hypothetical protein
LASSLEFTIDPDQVGGGGVQPVGGGGDDRVEVNFGSSVRVNSGGTLHDDDGSGELGGSAELRSLDGDGFTAEVENSSVDRARTECDSDGDVIAFGDALSGGVDGKTVVATNTSFVGDDGDGEVSNGDTRASVGTVEADDIVRDGLDEALDIDNNVFGTRSSLRDNADNLVVSDGADPAVAATNSDEGGVVARFETRTNNSQSITTSDVTRRGADGFEDRLDSNFNS